LAHVPDLNGFLAGVQVLLSDSGVATMEFPHLLRLMQENQFDTIYHEHFSYFSLIAVRRAFERKRLPIFYCWEVKTHRGSLRVYACHAEDASKATGGSVQDLLARETAAGLHMLDCYKSFEEQVRRTKRALLDFLISAKEIGKSVVAYGAPAKGNTL